MLGAFVHNSLNPLIVRLTAMRSRWQHLGMMITAEQIRIARVSLGLSQHQLARMTSLAPNTIKGVESGANPMVSTLRVLESALKAQGCLFGANDSVGVKMKWEGGRPRDPQVRASVLKILNSARKSRGQAPFVDID
jgi:transcriptional regulator with XRE-family HTH domain